MIKIKKMNWRDTLAVSVVALIAAVLCLMLLLYGSNFAVLNAKGLLAQKERHLIIFATLLSMLVIVPVYVMAFAIAIKYREGNKRAKYSPDWDHNATIEATWWLVPAIIILILSIVTWQSSQALDPFKPLAAGSRPLTIQVVALQWKWLFIYPDQNVASVNYVNVPAGRPITFQITADAPMNSFWIPQLSGQMYAMSGMSTELHIQADTPGNYYGSSANISGAGFARMHFTAHVSSSSEFGEWIARARQNRATLDLAAYTTLAEPGTDNFSTLTYGAVQPNLYNAIVSKFSSPSPTLRFSQPVHEHGGSG